jgi:menaquinone-9 beta-reductase
VARDKSDQIRSFKRTFLYFSSSKKKDANYHIERMGMRGECMRLDNSVLVIGGGPAGLAAGIAARLKGFDATVVDAAKPPIEKVCGEGLMPGTVAALRDLGVEIGPSTAHILRGFRFVDAASSVEACFTGCSGFGVRRTALHQQLVERAEECGVTLLWNAMVESLCTDGAVVGGSVKKAKWVIGADGVHSRVRRWAHLETRREQGMRFARRQHFRVKPWNEYVEVHWGEKMQAYVTPLKNGETCLALISSDPRMRLKDAWRQFPELARRLRDAETSNVERGTVTVTAGLRKVHRENIALVGDASGGVDAVTGEGLHLSFRQAIALADAMRTGDLQTYEREHRRLAKWPNTIGHILLLLNRYTWFRARAFRGLASEPELFEKLLRVYVEGPSHLLANVGLRFSWQFLTA